MEKALSNEEREKRLAEYLWLNYFNDYLLEHGTISRREHERMMEKILARKAKSLQGRESR